MWFFFTKKNMEFLPEKIEEYSINYTTKESELLLELNRETWAKVLIPRMLSGHLQGRLLSMFSKMIEAKTIVEIGTYTGYSALCLAEGLSKNGILHTIDINEEYIAFADKYFQRSIHKNQIKQHKGNAVNVLPNIKEKIQLVFIDADKPNYSNYFDAVIDKMSPGGFILADNVLWSGKVAEEIKPNDKSTIAINAFNKKVHDDPRVENVLIPIRDGIMALRKI